MLVLLVLGIVFLILSYASDQSNEEDISRGFLLLGLALGVIGAIGAIITYTNGKGKRSFSFTIDNYGEHPLKTIIDFASKNGYEVDDVDENRMIIILSDSATFSSYGFFYPIYLSKQDEEKLVVEIGIISKFFQLDTIINNKHEKCVNGIKKHFAKAKN